MNNYKNDNIEWDKFKHLYKRQEIPAKTILLNEGEISKHLYSLIFGNAIKKAMILGTFWKIGFKNRKWISFNQVKRYLMTKEKNGLKNLKINSPLLNKIEDIQKTISVA